MRKFRGKDVMTPAQIKKGLIALNEVVTADDSGDPELERLGVAIFADIDEHGATGAAVVGWGPEDCRAVDPVVYLPGKGRPFPVKAYVSALLVAEVESREVEPRP